MLMLYFSGTGNSKYIAESFGRRMAAECRSIEEKADFPALLAAHRAIGFCYPAYRSGVRARCASLRDAFRKTCGARS